MPKAAPLRHLRIIGGQWRGRRIPFREQSELRPTSDRIRETVFNWLMQNIRGRKVLDCYAGSGALGFEAASRGASQVTMIDHSSQVCKDLLVTIEQFSANNIRVAQSKLPTDLERLDDKYDIIFLDPPFHQNLIPECLSALISNQLLKPDSIVYIESEREWDIGQIGPGWRTTRSKSTGNVNYALCEQQKK